VARHAAIVAAENERTEIEKDDLTQAVADAVANQQQSIVNAYEKATHSPRENLYKPVLLACALARKNELGYFSAVDVREPMRQITHNDYGISAFSQHLNDFCEGSRGPILQKIGERRSFRFRFINPLLEQFVVLKGISDGMISRDQTSWKTNVS
jgi:hypothetical protein